MHLHSLQLHYNMVNLQVDLRFLDFALPCLKAANIMKQTGPGIQNIGISPLQYTCTSCEDVSCFSIDGLANNLFTNMHLSFMPGIFKISNNGHNTNSSSTIITTFQLIMIDGYKPCHMVINLQRTRYVVPTQKYISRP